MILVHDAIILYRIEYEKIGVDCKREDADDVAIELARKGYSIISNLPKPLGKINGNVIYDERKNFILAEKKTKVIKQ